MVVGEASTPDKAVDEEVELTFGEPANVTLETVTQRSEDGRRGDHTVTLRNANPFAIRYEIDFPTGGKSFTVPGKLLAKPGKRVWAVTIPANGATILKYRSASPPE
jgi:hypothetical protein